MVSLGALWMGDPQGSLGSQLPKRAGLEGLGLVGTPWSRPAVAAPASWPRAMPTPSLHPEPKRGARGAVAEPAPSLGSTPGPGRRGSPGRGREAPRRRGGGVGGGGSGESCSLSPPARSPAPRHPPPPPPEWFAPSVLFNPRDCSSAGSLPVRLGPGVAAAPGRPPVGVAVRPPRASPRGPGRPAPRGEPAASAMGAPSALALLLLCACCGAPGWANLSQDGECGRGGAGGGGGRRRGCPRHPGPRGVCGLCLDPGFKPPAIGSTPVPVGASVSPWVVGVPGVRPPRAPPTCLRAPRAGVCTQPGVRVRVWVWVSARLAVRVSVGVCAAFPCQYPCVCLCQCVLGAE